MTRGWDIWTIRNVRTIQNTTTYNFEWQKRPPRSHDMAMTVLDRTSQIVIFDCHCDTQKQTHEKCWKHQNQLNKSSRTLGIMKKEPCEGHLWLNVRKNLLSHFPQWPLWRHNDSFLKKTNPKFSYNSYLRNHPTLWMEEIGPSEAEIWKNMFFVLHKSTPAHGFLRVKVFSRTSGVLTNFWISSITIS